MHYNGLGGCLGTPSAGIPGPGLLLVLLLALGPDEC
jgi:hypothetical protein